MFYRINEEAAVSYAVSEEVSRDFSIRRRSQLSRFVDYVCVDVYRLYLKRVFDVVVSATMIVTLTPLLALLALFVVIGSGWPVFFSHTRVGSGGKPFKCLKFRSMMVGAEDFLQHFLATNAEARAEWERDHKLTDDPRVTRIGKFMRATSLDELPQLLNVLRGEMSLVGPRPVTQAELAKYGEASASYTALRPGITGMWQVYGRNDISYAQRIALDERYAREHSLILDIKILFKTVFAVLGRTGK